MKWVNYEFLDKVVEDLKSGLGKTKKKKEEIIREIEDFEIKLGDCNEYEEVLRDLLVYSDHLKHIMETPSKEEIGEALGMDKQSQDIWELRKKWIERESCLFSEKYPTTFSFIQSFEEQGRQLKEFLGNIREEGLSILKRSEEIWAVNTFDGNLSINIVDYKNWGHTAHLFMPKGDTPACLSDYVSHLVNLRSSSDIHDFVDRGVLVLMTPEQKDEYLKILEKEI